MSVRTRLERLRRSVGGLPPPGQLDLVVVVPVGSGTADGLPPGIHLNADGRVATVVFEGAGPGAAVMARLEARLAGWGKVITAGPEQVTAPPSVRDDWAGAPTYRYFEL